VDTAQEKLKLGSGKRWGRKQLDYLCVDLILEPFDINNEVLKLDPPSPEFKESKTL
jgi:hypothetical protein